VPKRWEEITAEKRQETTAEKSTAERRPYPRRDRRRPQPRKWNLGEQVCRHVSLCISLSFPPSLLDYMFPGSNDDLDMENVEDRDDPETNR